MNVIGNMDTESRPIKWVFDEFKKGNLFVDDSFQRNYIWIKKDCISLLETILLGYPIPEIYLWETGTDPNTGDTKYSIIDGQQRIRTIGQFIDGDLKLTNSGLEFTDAPYQGKKFEDLPPEMRSAIWSYKLSIRFVKNAVQRDDIVKMFLRLNKTSNSLNPQELRNAEFDGAFLKASEEVASLPFWSKWGIFSDREVRRMSDIQFTSTLLIFIRSGFEDETTQAAINKIYDLLNEDYPDKDENIIKINIVLQSIDSVLELHPELATHLQKKTHFYSIFTLFFALLEKCAERINYQRLSDGLVSWFKWYNNEEPVPTTYETHISAYRQLSQEGVQKKVNRLERYNILNSYIETLNCID